MPLGARVCVLNRTPANALRIVANLGSSIRVAPLDDLPEALLNAALVACVSPVTLGFATSV